MSLSDEVNVQELALQQPPTGENSDCSHHLQEIHDICYLKYLALPANATWNMSNKELSNTNSRG